MRKFSFLIGFGAGYVLGAKAGTQRYEQIRRLYNNVTSSSAFQQATEKAKEAVETGLGQAKDIAQEGVSKVRDRRDDTAHTGLTVAPPPS